MHWAVETRRIELAELLIRSGADVNANGDVSTTLIEISEYRCLLLMITQSHLQIAFLLGFMYSTL